jgi:DNA-binding PadR family transcriptional regulator
LRGRIASNILSLTSLGFGVDGETGFEKKRFDYTLSADGQEVLRDLERRKSDEYREIKDWLEKLSWAGDEDYVSLSIAAKTYHILKESNTAIRPDEVATEAKQFGWEISQGSIDKAIGFLSEMGMI